MNYRNLFSNFEFSIKSIKCINMYVVQYQGRLGFKPDQNKSLKLFQNDFSIKTPTRGSVVRIRVKFVDERVHTD